MLAARAVWMVDDSASIRVAVIQDEVVFVVADGLELGYVVFRAATKAEQGDAENREQRRFVLELHCSLDAGFVSRAPLPARGL